MLASIANQQSEALRLVPCPTLDELPAPPQGRTGWPWTEQPQRLFHAMPDGRRWPRLSIVTPSFNQAEFLEATIRSVLLQGYPALEYIVVDGGSTDESASIIERYAGWLSDWVSEPDRGQSHAINKGLACCGGEVFNWVNSDDQLSPGALAEVARLRVATQAAMLVGRGVIVDAQSGQLRHDWAGQPPRHPLDFIHSNRVVMAQPSTFLDTRVVRQVGGLREDIDCALDWELYLRLSVLLRERLTTATTPALLSYALYHPRSKTSSRQDDFQLEGLRVLRALGPQLPVLERLRLAAYVRGVVTQRLVSEVWTASHRWHYLGSLLIQRPDALWSRPYWGALRRVLVGQTQRGW